MASLRNFRWLVLIASAVLTGILTPRSSFAQPSAEETPPPPPAIGPRLDFPAGIASGGPTLYVANSRNNTISSIDVASGSITVLAGQLFKEGSNDGPGTSALFNSPDGVALLGNALYVVDTDNSDVRKIDLATHNVTTIAGTANISGTEDGKGTAAHFNLPTQICTDGKTTLYITDTGNSTIRKMVVGENVVSTIGGQAQQDGKTDGPASKSQFNRPRGLATDGKNLYVSDTANQIIRKIDLSTNTTTTIAGTGQPSDGVQNGTGTQAAFNAPEALATDGTNLYIADADNHAIRKMTLADLAVTTLTLVNGHIGSGIGITSDGKTVYYSDTTENSIQQVDVSNGNFTPVWPRQ